MRTPWTIMNEPSRLWRAVIVGTLALTVLGVTVATRLGYIAGAIGLVVGVGMLSWIMGYYGLLLWLLRGRNAQRFLPLLNFAKYPVMLLVVYAVVQGGIPMVIGFVIGVVVPLAVLTALAVWSALVTR